MSVIGGSDLTREIRRLKDIGKIDGMIGADNVGRVLDLHNQTLEKKKEKRFNKKIKDRNVYYRTLWKRAIEEVRSGRRIPKRLRIKKVFY